MESKKQGKSRGLGIYMQNILQRKIQIPFVKVGSNISEIIESQLIENYSGKCIKEGFVKSHSYSLTPTYLIIYFSIFNTFIFIINIIFFY